MKYVYIILITLIIIAGIFLFFTNYVTLGFLSSLSFSKPLVGTTITTITSATKISDLATILPNNFNALNTDKLEISTWYASTSNTSLLTLRSLNTVGTITSGVWNGTALTAQYGGTGSTTLGSNQVLLGNGTGAITNVFGYGTSGQFLTSNGAGNRPSWTSAVFDITAEYKTTGNWTFKGTVGLDSATSAAITLTATTTNFMGVMSRGEVENRLLDYEAGSLYFGGGVYTTITHHLSGAPRFARFISTSDYGTYAITCHAFASSTGATTAKKYFETICSNTDGSGASVATTSVILYNVGANTAANASTSNWTTNTFYIGATEVGTMPPTNMLWEIWR